MKKVRIIKIQNLLMWIVQREKICNDLKRYMYMYLYLFMYRYIGLIFMRLWFKFVNSYSIQFFFEKGYKIILSGCKYQFYLSKCFVIFIV